MFRTLKYRPNFPRKGFKTIEEARKWALEFVCWYNEVHLHSALNFVTPVQCHTGEHHKVLANRKLVYEKSKQKNPERWTGTTRNWSAHKEVALNPMKEKIMSE